MRVDEKLLTVLAKLSRHLLNDHKFVRKWKCIKTSINRSVQMSWNVSFMLYFGTKSLTFLIGIINFLTC